MKRYSNENITHLIKGRGVTQMTMKVCARTFSRWFFEAKDPLLHANRLTVKSHVGIPITISKRLHVFGNRVASGKCQSRVRCTKQTSIIPHKHWLTPESLQRHFIVIRNFHTTGRRCALPPLLWAVLAPIYKMTAILTGRKLRNRWKQLPPHIKKIYKILLAAGLGVLGLSARYYYTSHLEEAPFSGRKRFITLDKHQCCRIADYEFEGLKEKLKNKELPSTHPYYLLVVDICRRLVRGNKDVEEMKNQNWIVHVVQDPVKNAFVLPNGHIFVYTGMIEFCDNKDQLAVILGHEMAHALLLHAAEQLSYAKYIDYFVILLMTAIWTFLPNDGIALVFQWYCQHLKELTLDKPYSRVLEKEADYVGLEVAAKACFDIREGAVLWSKMSVSEDLEQKGKVPEWLSTHPTHENRVKNINELIPKNLKLRENCNCPRLPEPDPRTQMKVIREVVNELMIARAAKANLKRVEMDKKVLVSK